MITILFRQKLTKEIKDMKSQQQTFVDEKDSMLGEHQDFMKRKAKLDLDIKDLSEQADGDKTAKVYIYVKNNNIIIKCNLCF